MVSVAGHSGSFLKRLDTMGMFAAATAKDCTGCHSPDILDGRADAFAIATPMIQKARAMIAMMNTINRTYFGGQKRVSCATCHANASAPENVPNMAIQYGDPVDNPNSMQFVVAAGSNPNQIDQVISKGLLDDDRPVQILRGSNEGQPPVNFYFDTSGLLVRLLRWNDTAVGSVATQYDYSDYREVGGIRRPFRWVRTSTANQVTIVVKEMRLNVTIDPARFAKPATTRLIK